MIRLIESMYIRNTNYVHEWKKTNKEEERRSVRRLVVTEVEENLRISS